MRRGRDRIDTLSLRSNRFTRLGNYLSTLVLLNALGAKAIIDADFTRGAGYWAGCAAALLAFGPGHGSILLISHQAENDTGE